ncbi:MAG: universal stress protein [Chitinophagaceae bacterium]|nr:universal stress protein [Chitinophagaceae bacterium]
MKKILVPTDFSTCAANAMDFAIQTAKIIQAEITLLHAFDLPGSMYTDYLGVNKEFRQIQWNEDAQRLTAMKESIGQMYDIEVETRLVAAPLKIAIDEISKSEEYDLIIMGTLGAGGLKEKIWGSNTADVIALRSIPVLAIPYDYKWKKPEKFLLATGNFEKEPATLDNIFELAGLFLAHVDVAVFTDEHDEPATFIDHAHNAPYYGEILAKKYNEQGLHTVQLFGKHLEKSLQEYIDDNNIDVLAMITYKRGFWDRLFHPSYTKRMSYHTKVPLLAVPADEK